MALHQILTSVFRSFAKPHSSPVYITPYVLSVLYYYTIYAFRRLCGRFSSPFVNTHVVRVAEGELRGREQRSRHTGLHFFSFQGIPYAKPPLGTLRFQAPEPPEPWTGIRSALYERSLCIQPDIVVGLPVGDEDCLYLNVFTPKLPGVSSDVKPLPVLVWIHGGGYTYGSGQGDIYGPDYLMKEDIVLVTINYRLGIFGFLSLNNEILPGNAGLKDQVMALQWVKRNITQFGGDPNNVTIFGESAGSACVHFHLLSDMSRGLFHKAIGQSGSPLCPWGFEKSIRHRTQRIAEYLGCTSKDDASILKFLQNTSAAKLILNIFASLDGEERICAFLPFIPTVEPASLNAFITDEPEKLLAQGKFAKVPCIFGVNSREGLVFIRELNTNKNLMEVIEKKNLYRAIPDRIRTRLDEYPEIKKSFIKRLMEIYELDNEMPQEQLIDLFGDMLIVMDFVDNVEYYRRVYTKDSTGPSIYFNLFSFVGNLNFLKILSSLTECSGADHGDELGYLFTMEVMGFEKVKENSREEFMINCMAKWWTNFMRTGNPNWEGCTTKWEPLSEKEFRFLEIDNPSEMKTELFKDRLGFWSEFQEKLNLRNYPNLT